MTTFTVSKIDKHKNETQIHMTSDKNHLLRFYAGEKAWTFKAHFTGKISAKQLEKIIDVWYMFENQCHVLIGDTVTI